MSPQHLEDTRVAEEDCAVIYFLVFPSIRSFATYFPLLLVSRVFRLG